MALPGADSPPALRRRLGRLKRCVEVRPGCSEWEVELPDGIVRAAAYPELVGTLAPGDRVLLNATAAALQLGTGGVDFVIARLDEPGAGPFPGREAGHILKLRYSPLQLRVQTAEEEASPHASAVRAFPGLYGMPVLAAELLSQAAAAAIAARYARPRLRIALIHLDTAALPIAWSRLIARLRADGCLDATITVGQSFGGEYEAVNVYSGLVVARQAAGAELVIVTQGPGNVGTSTEYGFSGMALAEAMHAADLLGGAPVLIPRLSEAEGRERHRGVSHHTRTLLRCTRCPVRVPVPSGREALLGELPSVHSLATVDAREAAAALTPYGGVLTTMGRSLDEDRLFFEAAAAGGLLAAGLAPPGACE